VSQDDRAAVTGHPSVSSSAAGWQPLPPPGFDHLRKLTDPKGLWEHALISAPRVEHGFCTDDNARALVVVTRQASAATDLTDLAAIYLRFVLDARTASGQFHNRRHADGTWIDDIGSDDSQGRAWWGLGAVARLGPTVSMRQTGAEAFDTCASFDSPHLRANAYAALGAVEMLAANPGNGAAPDLLERTSGVIADAALGRIPWPESRLTYDNARLPEALIAAGAMLGRRRLTLVGIRLLEWLFGVETSGAHFSFTPDGGWTQGEPRPGFDQQPIEAWAMADASHRAWSVTGDGLWRVRALRASRWLTGHNDTGMVLYDVATGGTCDGLMEHSANENRGAESTLAGIGTLQVAGWLAESDDGLLVR
jgi:hypothetical protein